LSLWDITLVLVTGWFLLLPEEYVALGRSAMALAAIVANIYFWRNTITLETVSGKRAGGVGEDSLLERVTAAADERQLSGDTLPSVFAARSTVGRITRINQPFNHDKTVIC